MTPQLQMPSMIHNDPVKSWRSLSKKFNIVSISALQLSDHSCKLKKMCAQKNNSIEQIRCQPGLYFTWFTPNSHSAQFHKQSHIQ
jgi:hypothetical protein